MKHLTILILLNILLFSTVGQVFSESFYESNFRISLIGGFFFGNFDTEEEDKLFDEYKNSIDDIDANKAYVTFSDYLHYGIELDYFFTAGLFKPSFSKDIDPIESCQSCLFVESLPGIMYGIKTRYLHYQMNQEIHNVYGYYYSANFIDYDVVELGPEINLIFGNPESEILLYLQFYALYGRVVNGEINAGASIREAGIYMGKSEYYSKISDGHVISLGFGLFFSLNKHAPIFIGCSSNWSYFIFHFKDEIPVYGKNKISTWDDNFQYSVGTYF